MKLCTTVSKFTLLEDRQQDLCTGLMQALLKIQLLSTTPLQLSVLEPSEDLRDAD